MKKKEFENSNPVCGDIYIIKHSGIPCKAIFVRKAMHESRSYGMFPSSRSTTFYVFRKESTKREVVLKSATKILYKVAKENEQKIS
jgi:hypothetical protein